MHCSLQCHHRLSVHVCAYLGTYLYCANYYTNNNNHHHLYSHKQLHVHGTYKTLYNYNQ